MTPDFQRDEHTGLWKWPVLRNDDWKKWAREPCAVLFGQARRYDGIKPVASFNLSARWPRLREFCLGQYNYLVLAQGYSVEQALLLAEDVNRQLREEKTPSRPYEVSVEPELTWGITLDSDANWDLPNALAEVFTQVRRAIEEARFGSINITEADWQNHAQDEPVVCARRDGLTGLWNWHSLAALSVEWDDEPVALLMGDVDRLKTWCDNYGHGAGDGMLQKVGEVLRSIESVDVAAFRLGGDEFVVWARGFPLQRARDLAEEINSRVQEVDIQVLPSQTRRSLSLTWGVVGAETGSFQLSEMLRRADELVYAAKCEQRGSVGAEML